MIWRKPRIPPKRSRSRTPKKVIHDWAWECPNCSHENKLRDDLEMCGDCGEDRPEFNDCPECGTENPPENTHCYSCEAKLPPPPEPEPEPKYDQPIYRKKSEVTEIFRKLESHWGSSTEPFERAGYILPNGHFMNLNRPQTDHREVSFASWADQQDNYSGTPRMQELMIMGAIRIDINNDMLDLFSAPTSAQEQAIAKYVKAAGGNLNVDLQRSPYWDKSEAYFRAREHESRDFTSAYPGDILAYITEFYS